MRKPYNYSCARPHYYCDESERKAKNSSLWRRRYHSHTNDAVLLSTLEAITPRPLLVPPDSPHKPKGLLEITGVFRGRELTRKERRLTCGIAPLDRLIGGGIVRGRISEIIGNPGAGQTSLAAAFAASITARGEVAAWIDATGGFDPASIATAGVDLARMLWVAIPANRDRPSHIQSNRSPFSFPQDSSRLPEQRERQSVKQFRRSPLPPVVVMRNGPPA